ncbi:MAG: DUF1015 domain-containing protein [Candidatus Omnitrophica bacterium]|nr:DUF1015 domain-containing protein [Candidatus Omnitrophota bacterium]
MAKIKPFKAVIYNQEIIKDLSLVSCPPYDVISPSRQEYFHNISPFNFIHILFGKDIPGEDKYKRAGNYFKEWLKNKILIQEEKPSVYFYSQQYSQRGEKKTRLGFIALLGLEDKNTSVFGHEHTRLEPKEDRLKLIRQAKANLSPIFVIFSDQKRLIQRTYHQHVLDKQPLINITDEEKTVHKLWRLDHQPFLDHFQEGMRGTNIFIADGHHRYEVACAYRNQMKKRLHAARKDYDFNYILAYFTNIESRNLTILPIHRLVKLGSKFDLAGFNEKLKNCFDLEEVKDKIRFFFLLEKGGRTEHVLGMYKDKRYWLLRLKNIKILDSVVSDKPKEYISLDISILNYLVLKRVLGLDLEDKANITFSPNSDELIGEVDNNDSLIAFFLNPVKVEQLTNIALSGEKMPSKSTYFYPKVLSGLVINKHK